MINNKFKLIIALLLALTLSSGSYAYTFSTASGTIAITEPTGNVATSNVTATQPNWSSVLTPVTDTVNLRPDDIGDEDSVESQYPDSGDNWDKVDEETSDGDGTYVYTDNGNYVEDLYNITDHTTQTAAGPINYVKVYMVVRGTTTTAGVTAYVHMKTNGTEYDGSEEVLTTDYTAYSYQWTLNPDTGEAWTWSEIDALQIGVGLQRPAVAEQTLCTQVYAEVSFDAPYLSSSAPIGDLFEITVGTDYDGDLMVQVYLGNTDNLTKAYQQLNLQVYLENSVEAGETPNYRLLTLQNGMATLTLEGAGGEGNTLSVSGGDYTLTSRDSDEWETGWTVTPELYCEVTNR